MRRSLAVLLWIIAGLLACFLGTLSALVNTSSGRALLGAVARAAAAQAVGGRIEIGGVHGSLLTDLQLSEVRLYDPDSTLVAELPQVSFSYRLFDLLAGRVVLRDVTLDHPYVNLLQHKNGRLDIEELLHLGEHHGGPSGPAALVLLRDVRIVDGTVLLRLQARPSPSDSSAEIENAGADGRRRVRRFEHVHAVVRALRISSPTEKGIRIDVDSLATRVTDPAVVVRDLSGRAIIAGDSLDADFSRVGLPGTSATLKGKFRWPHGPILYDLAVRADSATLTDLKLLVPGFPAGAVYHGAALVRSHGPDLLEVHLDPLDVRYHGGTLTGRVTALSRAGEGIAALNGGDLTAQNFDLSFAEPFIDSLPFLGRLDGHTTVDGDIGALALSVDWTFRDSLVPGWPVSRIRGSGTVGVGAPLGLRFSPFTVQSATVDLGTARRAIPGLPLRGTLDASGTLTGRIRNVHFAGALRQEDGSTPATVAHGTVGFDTRTDTLGVTADLTADTLSFDGLRSSFPSLPLHGRASGTIRVAGTPGALDTHLDLAGIDGGGKVKAEGTVELAAARLSARNASVSWTDLDPQMWLSTAPPARLTGRATGSVQADSGRPPAGAVQAVFDPSMIGGAAVDGGWLGVRFADNRIYVDSLLLHQPGIRVTGLGDIGWRHPAGGSLIVDIEADSVDGLDSLLTWVTGVERALDGSVAPLMGDARASVTLDGALDSLTVTVRGSFERLRGRGLVLSGALAHFQLLPDSARHFSADVSLDSARGLGERVSALRASAAGRFDSLAWTTRAGLGDLATVSGGGRLRRAGPRATMFGLDSLALQIPGGAWSLDAPVDVAVTDSALHLGRLSLTQAGGSGRVTAQGDLYHDGPGQASLQVVGLPIAGVYALLERDTAGIGGNMTATLGVAGTRARPTYTGSFALSGASFADFRTPYVDGTVAYQDQRLDGTMHVWRSGQRVLNLTAHLPLDLALMRVDHRELPDTLAIRAVADSVDLSVLEAVTPTVRRVAGYLSADAGIRGTWDAPRLDGTIRIDSAGATIPSIGTRYEQLAGRFRLAGDTINVESLFGRSDKGTAQVTGFVRLDQLTKPVLALHISADRFKALDVRSFLSVTATAELDLTGPVFGATLTGYGTVTNGVLYFADLVNKRVINLDSPDPWIASLIDTSLAELIRRERLGPAFESVFLDSLRVNELQMTMGSDVWLRSTEANIQLNGTLALNKRLRNYLLSGSLETPRGTYRLAVGPVTREFTVTQGSVRYFGTPDLDAALDIRATHVVHPSAAATSTGAGAAPQAKPDVTVLAHIGGTLLAPKLSLSSDQPDLSQTEIISYLLFGQENVGLGDAPGSLGSRSALLTSAVASLVSGQLEQSVVSDLGIPIDYFEFRPGGVGDPLSGAQLAAGWQIGRKTFLVLNAGYCQNQNVNLANYTLGASLQFRISPEWRTEASFEPVQSCSITYLNTLGATAVRQVGLDLFWERRY